MYLAKKKRKPFFWIDWEVEDGPAIRPWGPGAKGLPLTFANAKNDLRTTVGPQFRGTYIPQGIKRLSVWDVYQQEEARRVA